MWGGGGVLSFIYLYMKIQKRLKLKDFEPSKIIESLRTLVEPTMCENIGVLPPLSPASMLVHEATVCQSVSFIWASKGFVIELVCWSV